MYFPFPLDSIGKRVPSGNTNCKSTVDVEGKLTSVSSALQLYVVSVTDSPLTKLAGVNPGGTVNINAVSKTEIS